MNITIINDHSDIEKCFDAFLELRPHLKDKKSFTDQVLSQQKEGYEINGINEDDEIVACIGFRVMTTLAWGKILYIDDLITKAKCHGKGYGGALLTHAINHAKKLGCDQVHLDTGYTRHAAHRVYLKHGFEMKSHHLALELN